MILLTDKQIDFIELDIRSKGISMESLQHDLLDHICCILEREWDGTGSFESVYEKVIVRFYKNELKEVEQETILLLQYKNYYKMKKTMMKSGMIAAILIVLGSFFKYMFWNGASVLLLSGVLLFAFVFLPLVCILQTRELKTSREKLTLVLGTAIGVLYSLSMTFQVMHWEGKRVIWLFTMFLTVFVFLPAYFFSGIRKPEGKSQTIIFTIIIISITGIQFMMTALRPSKDASAAKVFAFMENEQILNRMQSKSALMKTETNPASGELQQVCDKIKMAILKSDFKMNEVPSEIDMQSYDWVEKGANYFMKTENSMQLITELKAKVEAYNQHAEEVNKIPVKNTILDSEFLNKEFCTDYVILNNLTQLQLYSAIN